jgi:outer membrane lipoprotein carrier protein
MRFRALGLALAVLAAVAVPPAGAADPAVELAGSLQRKYDTVKDFSADFVHAYRGGVLRRQRTERGRLLVKKPGRWRWEYTSPEEKLFISDGATVWYYMPEDRQVVVGPVPDQTETSTPALFLAGKGNLVRDFKPSLVESPEGMPPGSRALKLVPSTRQLDYESLILVVEPRSLSLVGLVWQDAQGGVSSFAFTNLKENVGPADRQFVFAIPRGVDVVEGSSPR